MAIRIIKQGLLTTKVYRGTCTSCNTEFECTESDLSGSTVSSVECPLPGCYTFIDKTKMEIMRIPRIQSAINSL